MRNILFVLLFLNSGFIIAQKPQTSSSSEILLSLKKAQTLGSVLYVAAHPDDENTRLITWLANEKHLNTAYLSITRGDGGQNLIGPEIREQLGIIRTQELLAARRMDGGQQYFTRANDFGFSKNPEETFTIWDKEQVLADMVWVIRKFRPDVIITRFSAEPSETHGHHTASAILAAEAFEAAGDKERFPEQLQYVDVWQAKALYWNTSWWFYGSEANFDPEGLLKVDVGTYNPLLGKSYSEIAAESRSMHKSQGFGSSGSRGTAVEYLKPLKGATSSIDLLEGIDASWTRLEGGRQVSQLLAKAESNFNHFSPSLIIPTLVEAYRATENIKDTYWKSKKQDEIKALIKACAGLYLEVAAKDFNVVAGQKLEINFEAVNRSTAKVILQSIAFKSLAYDSVLQKDLVFNEKLTFKKIQILPQKFPQSQPYWLEKEGSLGMFSIENQQLVGLPENLPALSALFSVEVEGLAIQYQLPVVYKTTDPVDGEVYKPLVVTPEVFVKMAEQVYLFNGEATKKIEVKVKAGKANVQGVLSLKLPQGWKAEPESQDFRIGQKGEEQTFAFEVKSPDQESQGYVSASALVEDKVYRQSLGTIDYDHIPLQTLFPEAKAKVVKLSIAKKGKTIGYIMGAGDDIPASLQQIGYEVEILDPRNIDPVSLAGLDAIIMGVRAYNTIEELKFAQNVLLEYVKKGGNLIVQYNTNSRLVTDKLAPYPLKIGRDRVTVENAPVRFVDPKHAILNTPNKITEADFEGWVQERGLYFASDYAPEFEAILSSQDPGEAELKGGLLVARYGKGYYIYTGYSWFRQLPAGVPGAYKMFVNMISLGKQ